MSTMRVCVTVVDREFYIYIVQVARMKIKTKFVFVTLVSFFVFRFFFMLKNSKLMAGIDSELSSELSPPRERFFGTQQRERERESFFFKDTS